MFQAVLCIDHLNCLKLWESVGPGMHIGITLNGTKLQNYLKFREKRPYLLCVVVAVPSSASLCDLYKRMSQRLRSFQDHVDLYMSFGFQVIEDLK